MYLAMPIREGPGYATGHIHCKDESTQLQKYI